MTMQQFTRTLRLGSALLSLTIAQMAAAQAVEDGAATDTSEIQDGIIVTGTRGSLSRALEEKQADVRFVDAIVAEDIAQFPDRNIAEALQRVPGVTVNRTLGEGRTIVVRGFTPDFTRVELNGMSAVTVSDSRNFDFGVLASELFASAVVQKSNSARDTEGGLAATVNLTTPKPLELDEFVLRASTDANYAELADEFNPRGSVVVSKRWGDTFGIAASFAYSDSSLYSIDYDVGSWDTASDSIAAAGRVGLSPETLAARLPRVPLRQLRDQNRERIGGTLDVQWHPADWVELGLSGIYSLSTRTGPYIRLDFFELEGGLLRPRNLVVDNGRIVSGTFAEAQPRAYTQYEDNEERFANAIFDAKFDLGDGFEALTRIGYGRSTGEFVYDFWSFGVFGEATYALEGNFIVPSFVPDNNNDRVLENGGQPIDFSNPAAYVNWRFFSGGRLRQVNEEVSAEIEFSKTFDGPLSRVRIGGRYADQTADRKRGEFVARPSATTPVGGLGAAPGLAELVPWNLRGAPNAFPDTILRIDNQTARQVFNIGEFERPVNPLQSFLIGETSYAGYIQGDIDLGNLRGDIGVRVVRTEVLSSGTRALNGLAAPIGGQLINDVEDVEFTRSYTEVLPALNLRYEFTPDLLVRGSIGKTLTRPQLSDLSPEATIDIGRNTGRSGNPELDPYTAWNFDLGLEYYFGPEALIAVAGFHKEIGALVETLTENVTLDLPGTQGEPARPTNISLQRPINGESARVTGFEAIIQSPFTFLPEPLDGFGGVFNYAYLKSEATFQLVNDVRSVSLPGLSEHSFNAILYYQKGPIDIRGSYNWRDDYLETPFGAGGQPIYRDAFGQLDLSVTYRVSERLVLRAEAINLTKSGQFNYTDQREDLPTSVADNERIFSIGARFAL
jgi:TonB-dependent receptor